MKKKSYENFEKIKNIIDPKALSELEKLKVQCDCGHKVVMPVYLDTMICDYCGRKIRNNTKSYFMYKMRKELQKNEK